MNDHKLSELAREYSMYDKREKAAQAKKNKRKAAIIKELQHRGTDALEHDGIRITLVQQDIKDYPLENFERALPSNLYKRILKRVIDKDKIQSLVMAGKIEPELVDECVEVRPKAPYIQVSEYED